MPGTRCRARHDQGRDANATPTLNIPDGAFTFEHMAVGGTTWLGGTGGPDEIEKVTITYTWPLMTPLLRPFFPAASCTSGWSR